MDALLIATGFTGALTLLYLARLVRGFFHAPLTVEAYFSPSGGCTDVVVREIAAARREILVLAYSFTSRPITQALVDARMNHHVNVEIVLDHSNEKDAHSELPWLLEHKLEPLIDTHHAIAHNKVMLIDGKTLLTGSFNFTQQAESHNAENLVVIKGHPELITSYRFDFDHHKKHSRKPETGVAASPAADHHHGHAAGGATHHDVLTAVARGATLPDNEEGGGEPVGPLSTRPAAELYARRKETHGEHDHSAGKAA